MRNLPGLSHGRQGLHQWREQLHKVCGRFDTKAGDDVEGFFGGITVGRIGTMAVVDVATNAQALRKSAQDVRAEDGQHFFLIYQQAGNSVLLQHGKQAALGPGDCALIDSRYSSEFRYLGGMRHLSFHLPCDALEQRMPGRQPRICETIRADQPLGNVLGGFIDQIAAKHLLFDARESLAVGDALLSMLAPLSQDVEQHGGSLRDYARVVAYIEGHLQDDLLPECIARHVGVSVRSLYRLFEERSQRLGTYVREARLKRCAEQLRASSHRDENLTCIAHRWGFKDSAHFSRTFRAYFGVSPRDYRRA
jgi:AraC family transcriptional activator of tynA and feaB